MILFYIEGIVVMGVCLRRFSLYMNVGCGSFILSLARVRRVSLLSVVCYLRLGVVLSCGVLGVCGVVIFVLSVMHVVGGG